MPRSHSVSSLDGKVCIVTGANTGIGYIAALEMARAGAHVVLTCRTAEKGAPVVERIQQETGNSKVECLPMELGNLSKVKAAAEEFLAKDLPLDILLNNAGLAGQRGQTDDGFEIQFGVNHMGPALFTRLLDGKLRESAPARVVFVASRAHIRAKNGVDLNVVQQSTPSTAGFDEYSVSKLANVLYSRKLADHFKGSGVTTYALHPGVVATDVWRRIPSIFRWIPKLFMITPEQGAQTSLYCCTEPSIAADTGLYYDDCAERKPNRFALDDDGMNALWDKTEEWLAPYLS